MFLLFVHFCINTLTDPERRTGMHLHAYISVYCIWPKRLSSRQANAFIVSTIYRGRFDTDDPSKFTPKKPNKISGFCMCQNIVGFLPSQYSIYFVCTFLKSFVVSLTINFTCKLSSCTFLPVGFYFWTCTFLLISKYI